jgi:hypothetical protein
MTKTASNIGVPVAWTYLPLTIKVYHIISGLVKVFSGHKARKRPLSIKKRPFYIY